MLFLFIIAIACFAFAGISIFGYLTSTFELLKAVREHAPETWERLGRPEAVRAGTAGEGMTTIQPLGPWLSWVWAGDTANLPTAVARRLRKTSKLLRRGIVGLAMVFASFGLLMALAPSS